MSLIFLNDDMDVGLPKEKFIRCSNCGYVHDYLERDGYLFKFLSHPLICFAVIEFNCDCGHNFKIEDSVISQQVIQQIRRSSCPTRAATCHPGTAVYPQIFNQPAYPTNLAR